MDKFKNSLSCKALIILLSFLMMLSVLPVSAISVLAATEEVADYITITVTDEDNNAIEDANVNFVVNSTANGDDYVKKNEKTDANGCVKVLSSEDYLEDDMTLTATISKDKFKTDSSIENFKLTATDQNINVVLKSTVINGVEVSGQKLTYNGDAQKAVVVSKKSSDTVDYEYDSEKITLENGEPYVTDAGTYEIKVTITRDGYEPYEKTVTTVVEKADIDGISFEAIEGLKYNGKEQDLVKVSGLDSDTDSITYEVNGKEVEVESGKVPQEMAVAKYKVKLTVDRGENYNKYSKTVESEISLGKIDLGGLTVTGLDSFYTGDEQEVVEVSGKGDYSLTYEFEGKDYGEEIPTVVDAGSYTVYVHAIKENYEDEDVEVVAPKEVVYPFNVYVAKQLQTIYFNDDNYADGQITSVDIEEAKTKTFDFSAAGGSVDTDISYSIKNVADDGVDVSKIAEIDTEKGTLKVKAAGSIDVIATKPGDDNHKSVSISHNLIITVSDGLVEFDNVEIKYVFGEEEGVASDATAQNVNDNDNGNHTYSIDKTNIGLSIDEKTGKITISDYTKLSEELEKNGKITIVVTVNKDKGTMTTKTKDIPEKPKNTNAIYFSDANKWGKVFLYYWIDDDTNNNWPGQEMEYYTKNDYGESVYRLCIPTNVKGIVFSNGTDQKQTEDITKNINDNVNYYPVNKKNKCKVGSTTWEYPEKEVTQDIYGEDSTSYQLEIKAADIPAETYTLAGTKGDNGWYRSAVTVTPADEDNYTISKTPIASTFTDSVTFDDQGVADRYIYLKNKLGGITPKIKIDGLKIDTEKPDPNNFTIEFSEPKTDKDNTKYYKDGVTVTFTVNDELNDDESGVQYITWNYTKADNATSSILTEKKNQVIPEKVDGKYVASITLDSDAQYRGNVSFTATDNAGNPSEVRFNDTIIVVDSINPKMQAAHQLVNPDETYNPVGNKHYYSNDVKFTFTVNEANFFKDDFKVQLSKDNANKQDVAVTWSHEDEIHTGSFVISGDGDYKVYVNPDYADRSGNIAQDKNNNNIISYESEVITIDTISPVISCDFDKNTQTVKFTVNEHNFRSTDINVEYTVVDINGNKVEVKDINDDLHNAEWKNEKADVYTYETRSLADGLYSYNVSYTDISKNSAEDKTNEFIIDHSKPSNPEITYSTPIIESIISSLTFGFYNPTVDVTFTSYDNFSGVDTFKWSYVKQSGASEINVPTGAVDYSDKVIPAVQDSKDKSKFTATIKLPLSVAEQLRGCIAVSATDKYNNTSNKVTDENHIIVVDTIVPEMTVEYSEASRTVGKVMYYGNDKKGQAVVTFKIKEANFFAEDVVVSVSKNGEEKVKVTPTWTDESVDDHVGTYIISGDGHYIVYVDYTDRSNNKMTSYTSDTITIDTINPVIKVDYHNNDVKETLTDTEDHNRKYFDSTQKATVTITEHNFNAEEVDFSKIVGKDVTGAVLNIDSLSQKTSWTSKGDVHTITFTYSGDANYTFDLDYTDLANNKADDYKPDYFTVDTKAPTVTSVSYSTSVLDTVIGNVSFGFYGDRMNVTITATDDTSGVHGFVYNYRNASGVSSVNAELINQAIEEGSITYSSDRKTATLVFNIPKEALGSNNQFNGTVDFTSTDRSHNEVKQQEEKRVVVDNISPTCNVSYSSPVNEMGGVSYYSGDITGTITIDEANFYSEDVVVTYSINGGSAGNLPVSWSDSSVDVHNGSFTISGDGDYIINITYTDKSGNVMGSYTSNQLTIDTKIDKPTFTINGEPKTENGGAYKDNATIGFSYSDQNFNSREIKLTRTRFKDKDVDVTDKFVKETQDGKGGSGSFDIPKEVENDGIYTLTISMTDKANHSTSSFTKFTINRYGSVYEYSDYLMSLIKDGGQYVTIGEGSDAAITDDLIITEYNADRIVEDSLNILITRDGEPIETVYKSEPEISNKVEIGDSGWYQYMYTIDKSNFAQDGVYKISLSSKDATKNESKSVPDNSINAKGDPVLDTMQFVVDTTAPEIRNVANLDEAIVNAQEIDVKYSLVDIGGLKSVEVFVDDESVDEVSDFSENPNDYSGNFTIKEKNSAQKVRIIVTDLAGNITDTNSDSFDPGDKFVFVDAITVSTNFFVRWFANKPLFFGSIGGAVAILAGAGVLIGFKARKKKKA